MKQEPSFLFCQEAEAEHLLSFTAFLKTVAPTTTQKNTAKQNTTLGLPAQSRQFPLLLQTNTKPFFIGPSMASHPSPAFQLQGQRETVYGKCCMKCSRKDDFSPLPGDSLLPSTSPPRL